MSARARPLAFGGWALALALLLPAPLAAQRPADTLDSALPAVVQLRVVATPDGALAIADNPLSGPVEVLLRADGTAPHAAPALPARATGPARGSAVISRLHGNGQAVATAGLRLTSVPGAGYARYANRRTSRRPRTTVSRISPANPASAARIVSPVTRIAVGKRGTSPVCA